MPSIAHNDLTTGSVGKRLFAFLVPIFLANLLQTLYGTVDLLMVGKFAATADVSAVATGSMTMQTISGIITGLTMGCTIQLGHAIGQKDLPGAKRAVASALCLFSLLSVVLMIPVVLLSTPIAKLMNAPVEALAATASYVRICGVGILAIVLFNALSGIFRGAGDSRTPLLLVGIACVGNILGDLLLVGVLQLGAAGAAIATVLAQCISAVCALVLLQRGRLPFTVRYRALRMHRVETVRILKYGAPIAAQEALTGLSFLIIMAILNGFGLVESAGVGVAEKICGLMFLVPGAVIAAVSSFSAQNIGAGLAARARRGMYLGMLWSVAVGLGMFLFCFFRGELLAALFSDDAAVIAAAADYLRTYAIDCVIVGVSFSMIGYLNGCGKTTFVAVQGILSTFCVRIPLAYAFSLIPNASLLQVGLATPLATVFAIVLILCYYTRMRRRERHQA